MSYSPPRRPLRFARSLFLSGAAALLLAPLAAGAQDSASAATAQSRAKNADWLYAGSDIPRDTAWQFRSEEHTSELQSLMRISYAVFCLTKKRQEKRTLRDTKNKG